MTESKEPAQAQVRTNDDRHRVLFRGALEDAKVFVEQHFPRVHLEPNTDYGDEGPKADVVVEHDGNVHTFKDSKWADKNSEPVTLDAPASADADADKS